MDIFKIFAVAITGTVLYIFVKEHKPELAAAVQTATVLVLFIFILSYAGTVVNQIRDLIGNYSLKAEFVSPMIKALGIAIITQITADLCKDNGNSSAGAKVEFAGRVLIIAMMLPMFKAVADFAMDLIGG